VEPDNEIDWPVPRDELKYAGVEVHLQRMQQELDAVFKPYQRKVIAFMAGVLKAFRR